ncbi:MAG: hypothetical protein ACREEB_17830 [Caulobacteraceae bacterium]
MTDLIRRATRTPRLSPEPDPRDGPAAASEVQPRPIFLHGLWRSGSTFVWSRFRAAEGVRAHFEPLSPSLARLTRERIHRQGWQEALARNRHPRMDRPYFAEYEPLVGRRGVQLYDRRFASERFALLGDDTYPELEAYIANLVACAWAEGRRPVLGFVRTALRMGRLRAVFGAYDAHIDRDPLGVWSSYSRHAGAGTYDFFVNLLLIVERNAGHPLFAPLAARHRPRSGLAGMIKPKRYYRDAIESLAPEHSYGLVFYFWLLSILHALAHGDMIVDMSLAERPGYAQALEVRLRRECGLAVRLDGLTTVREPEFMTLFDRRAAEARMLAILPLDAAASFFDLAKARRRLDELAPAKAAMLADVLEALEGARRLADGPSAMPTV